MVYKLLMAFTFCGRSLAYRRTCARLAEGYRLAHDTCCVPGPALSGWWLTDGTGPIEHVAASVARRLIADGAVRQVELDDKFVVYVGTED